MVGSCRLVRETCSFCGSGMNRTLSLRTTFGSLHHRDIPLRNTYRGYEKLQPAIQHVRHSPLLASQVRMRQRPSYSARQMKPNLGRSRRNRKASLIYRGGLCCLFLFLIWPTVLMGPTIAQEMQWNMAAKSTNELQPIWHENGYTADTPCVINDAISDNMVTASRMKGDDHKWWSRTDILLKE